MYTYQATPQGVYTSWIKSQQVLIVDLVSPHTTFSLISSLGSIILSLLSTYCRHETNKLNGYSTCKIYKSTHQRVVFTSMVNIYESKSLG